MAPTTAHADDSGPFGRNVLWHALKRRAELRSKPQRSRGHGKHQAAKTSQG
jgi:hypothetical protein